MTAEMLLKAVAPSQRPAQLAIAQSIERFLADDGPTLCVNAETGIGKTLAYAAPVALAACDGRKTVISTHTIQQLHQVKATLDRLIPALPTPVRVARRLGRANFLSAGRIARILANRDDLDTDQRALLEAARADAGLIDEFESRHGPLPVPRADICLTSSCRHQHAYAAQQEQAGAAEIVLQTHAMSVLDAVRREVRADIVVHDEADALPHAAAGFAESRVTPLDLAMVLEKHEPAGLREAITAFAVWAADTVGCEAPLFANPDSEAVRHAEAIRRALAGIDSEHARDLRRSLVAFIKCPDSPYRGAAIVKAPAGHAFTVLALDPGRVLRGTYAGRKTLFVSATLAVGSDDFMPFLQSVGAPDSSGASAAPENFGSMAFTLADRAAPLPFEGGARVPAFHDHAAGMVRAAMAAGGRVLVLTPSFDDVADLAARIPSVIAHRRGEPLAPHLETLKSTPNGVLATPAAWAGTDLPGLLDHIVILRLPFLPLERARVALLDRLLRSRGYGEANAESILYRQDRRETLRRLAQGFGRGIRTPEDRVRIWIADPRFPLPDTLTLDPRRRLSQGPAARNRDLAGAIPGRFGEAYEQAELFRRPDPGLLL